jgi:hypothetical protein
MDASDARKQSLGWHDRYFQRSPVAGHCVSIDGDSWHSDGECCECCGFGIDDYGDGCGFWREPLVKVETPA